MQREVFMRTMHEKKKETTNQAIAKQQDQFQQFLENLKEQIIEAVRQLCLLPLLCHHQVQDDAYRPESNIQRL